MRWLRLLILSLSLLSGLSLATVSAQDTDDPTIVADDVGITEPEIDGEAPESKLPDDLDDSPLPQWWQGAAGIISIGLTAFLIRWFGGWIYKLSLEKQTDAKRGFGIASAVIVGLIGAWLADTLAFDKVTLSGIFYTAVTGYVLREFVPGVKSASHSLEGR